ncbi:mRNA cleavage and polyadenylation factor CLP1 [Spathaspora sp. JA1]|nr:mRNA cleavage and polyadenylation factor CLP1 [Spathaspora sp. JA1]
MSIPGFGTSDPTTSTIKLTIPAKAEWRLEIPFKTTLDFTVTSGIAEIFGTELPLNVHIHLTGVKCAIFAPVDDVTISYHLIENIGELGNSDDSEFSKYISHETCMDNYINLHLLLEQKRQMCIDHNILHPNEMIMGPRVLILGDSGCGKTSLSKILCGYAVKMDNCPILVNLNPRDGVFSLPGSLSATPISDSFDLETSGGYGFTTTSGSLPHNPKQPIVKNFGFSSIRENLDLYKYQISQLGITVLSRLEQDLQVRNGGLIIDTPSLNIKDFNIIENIVSDFQINTLVVIGNEKFSIELSKKFKHKSNLDIIKVLASPGVVHVNESFIRRLQEQTIKEYFHGSTKIRLSPFKTDIDLHDNLVIYKPVVTRDLMSSLSFLPIGEANTAEEVDEDVKKEGGDLLEKYYTVLQEPSSSNLDNSIIAITQLPLNNNKSARDLLNTSVLGYVHVSKFDDEKKKLKVLLPFPGVFPRNVLIATNIGFNE